MTSRAAWLPTLLQPVAAVLVILGGAATQARYPAGRPAETWLLVALVLVTLPGLVTAMVHSLQRTRARRHGPVTDHDRATDAYARMPPAVPRSRVPDLCTRLAGWGSAQVGLSLGTALLLITTPLEQDWALLALAPVVLVLALGVPAAFALAAWLAGVLLRQAARPRAHHPLLYLPDASAAMNARPPAVFRGLLAALGVGILGLVLTAVVAVGVSFVDAPPARGGWALVQRAPVVMAIGGLGAALLLVRGALRRMAADPERPARPPEG